MLYSSRRAAVSLVLLFAICLAPRGPAFCEQQLRLAVLEFDNPQSVKIDRTYYSDLTRGAVQKRLPQLFVMTREGTEALLQANGKTLADCTGECEVQVGRQLGADFIVSGRITQIGSRLVVTMRLFNTADARLLDSEEARGKSQDDLLDEADKSIARLVERLAQTLAPAPAPIVQAPAPAPAQSAPQPPAAPQNQLAQERQTDDGGLAQRMEREAQQAKEQALAAEANRSTHAAPAPATPTPVLSANPPPTAPSWVRFSGTGNHLVQGTDSGGGGASSDQLLKEGGTELFNGVKAHYDELEGLGSPEMKSLTRTYYTSSARGVEMLGLRLFIARTGAGGFTTESETTYSPPMLLSPHSSTKGFTWDETSVTRSHSKSWIGSAAPTESDNESESKVHGEVTGEESVTIGGKSFRCKILHETLNMTSESPGFSMTMQTKSKLLFSPALGMVELDSENTSSYHGKDTAPVESKGSMRLFVKEASFATAPWFTKAAAHTR